MTTIYVNHKKRLVLTDSCVSTFEKTVQHTVASYYLPFLFKPKVTSECIDKRRTTCKATWIHDRIFVGSGDVTGLSKYFSNTFMKCNYKYNDDEEFTAMLVGASWIYITTFREGVLKKKFEVVGDRGYIAAFGSGSSYSNDLVYAPDDCTEQEIIELFKKCAVQDIHSDDNVNVYRIQN